jgi:peptidyl-prolyl cis-trans isomerase C
MRRGSCSAMLAVLVLVGGCSKKAEEKKKGSLVAKGDGVAITAEELKAKLDEQSPLIRARYSTLDRKKEFLDNMIRFEVLVNEAKAQKLDQDPEVLATIDKILVQRLTRKAFEEKAAAAQVPDAELRKYYDEHLNEFQRPERVRLSHIFVKSEKGSPDRAKKATEAKKLYARLKEAAAKSPLAFANLAREVSDDIATKAAGGDMGLRTREELEKEHSKELADAAFALSDPGQETGIVESSKGFHILKLGLRQPGMNRSFDEVKPQLAARLGRERRARGFEEYVKSLREKANVKIDDAELEKIAVSPSPAPTPAHKPAAAENK